MSLTKEQVVEILKSTTHAPLITLGEKGMTSRTMSFVLTSNDHLFMLTHKGTSKLSDIHFSKQGLIHVCKLEEDITKSFDISIRGTLECISSDNPLYDEGAAALGEQNPQIADLLSSDAGINYELLHLKITSLQAWDYIQILSGGNKTVVI